MATQLTLQERERVAQLLAMKTSHRKIGQQLGRSHTTISREVERNGAADGYWPAQAQQRALTRRRERPLTRKLDDPELNEYVRVRLARHWSPEQIAGRRRREQPSGCRVSHEAIYRWIRNNPQRTHWERCLRRGGRRKALETRGKIPRRVEIAGRPPVVSERSRHGDWEGDTSTTEYSGRQQANGMTMPSRHCRPHTMPVTKFPSVTKNGPIQQSRSLPNPPTNPPVASSPQ
jgi:IS30 family transposase